MYKRFGHKFNNVCIVTMQAPYHMAVWATPWQRRPLITWQYGQHHDNAGPLSHGSLGNAMTTQAPYHMTVWATPWQRRPLITWQYCWASPWQHRPLITWQYGHHHDNTGPLSHDSMGSAMIMQAPYHMTVWASPWQHRPLITWQYGHHHDNAGPLSHAHDSTMCVEIDICEYVTTWDAYP